jgi:hypothetical protein
MTKHHFIPVSIISSFASDQAWQLVKETEDIQRRIANSDKVVMSKKDKKRLWPICVYEKNSKRMTRMKAEDVCSTPNLYSVHDPNNQLTRALIRYILEEKATFNNLDELFLLGEKHLDTDMIESTQVAELDHSFASILSLLKTGQQISDSQINIIYRFVIFAHFRTPAWRRVHYVETFEPKQKKLKESIMQIWIESRPNKPSNKSIEAINDAFDNNFYQMAMIQACSRESKVLSRINAKVLVLHRKGSIPFVTCDNPARPYFPDRIQQIDFEGIPGMSDPRSQLTFPIDPNTCLLVSSNPTYPNFSHKEVNDKQIRTINCALALMADKEIIFADPNTNVFEDWLNLGSLKPIRRP